MLGALQTASNIFLAYECSSINVSGTGAINSIETLTALPCTIALACGKARTGITSGWTFIKVLALFPIGVPPC